MGLLPWAQEAPGSNPGAPTKLFKYLAERSISLSEPGVNPWIETLSQGTLCRKGAARAKKTSGTISEGAAANGCRAFQDLQEHIRAITRTRPSSKATL